MAGNGCLLGLTRQDRPRQRPRKSGGRKHRISASVKDFLFTIDESQRFGCALDILQFLLSLTFVFRDIVLMQIADLIGKALPCIGTYKVRETNR